jgi:hypothetical protein
VSDTTVTVFAFVPDENVPPIAMGAKEAGGLDPVAIILLS